MRDDPKLQQALADDWNAKHPVGTPVMRYRLINPRAEPTGETKTRSEAWVMGGHTAMVMVKGIAGGVHLQSVVPLALSEPLTSTAPTKPMQAGPEPLGQKPSNLSHEEREGEGL